MTRNGIVKRTWQARRGVTGGHAPQIQSATSAAVPPVQLVSGGDPAGGDDVRPFPLPLRNCEDLLFERGIDICHETVRMWWNRFGPMFAGDIRLQRVRRMRGFRHWRWHLDEMYVKLNGEMAYLSRAVDQEGEILESYVTRTSDKDAALTFMKKALKRHWSPEVITTDGLRSCGATMKELGKADKQETARGANNRVDNSHLPFRR